MSEEKDVNCEAYKKGWVAGYCDGRDDENVSDDECLQYSYGFEDGMQAYIEEMNKNNS
jgi:hypothetical protein